MEGAGSTMDFTTDQPTAEREEPEAGAHRSFDEADLTEQTEPIVMAPIDAASVTSATELNAAAESAATPDTPNSEALDRGEDGIDTADPEDLVPAVDSGEQAVVETEPIEIHAQRVVEAILFAADSPMPPAKIAAVLGVGDARDVRKHVEQLNSEYASQGLAFRIEQLAGGYQMLTLPAYNPWLRKLLRARQETRLSPAALETLAIVAYKQPCTRAEVEAIRGVAAGDLINRLREMDLVKIVGRAEDLGRPLLYGTTRRFLEVFGLPSLEELPQVEALSGGSNGGGAVRETAKMPAAALANGAVEEQRSAEQMREARQVPDALPQQASVAADEAQAPLSPAPTEPASPADPTEPTQDPDET